MKPIATTLATTALCLMLAACGGGKPPARQARARSFPPPATVARPAPPRPIAPPKILSLPGLEGVIGANGSSLQRQFGTARLDVLEGDVRKLQFSGNACVLDIFLYPPAAGQEPQATYVEARRASDGREVDRASCIAALRKP